MAECRYPGKTCVHMVESGGVVYCGSVPCILKGKIPEKANTGKHMQKIAGR